MTEHVPSPELIVLAQEIRADREAIDRHASAVSGAMASAPWGAGVATLSVVAVSVHHFYGGAESAFERIARAFEGTPDRSDRWHQELLERMALALAGVRPADEEDPLEPIPVKWDAHA